MIILDSNVVSALMDAAPDQRIKAWLDRQPRSSLWTTAITVFEVEFGLAIMPEGKRKAGFVHAFAGMLEELSYRIAAYDAVAARHAAALMAARNRRGRPVDLRDTMIAGIVLAHHATLATRNVSHFADIEASVINPWDA